MIALMSLVIILIVLAVWMLIEVYRTSKTAFVLYLVIPFLLTSVVLFYWLIDANRGYATDNLTDLNSDQWQLLYYQIDGEKKHINVLIKHKDQEPRLYVLVQDFEKNKKKLGQIDQQLAKGVPITGKKIRRDGNEQTDGEFIFYALPPSVTIPKN